MGLNKCVPQNELCYTCVTADQQNRSGTGPRYRAKPRDVQLQEAKKKKKKKKKRNKKKSVLKSNLISILRTDVPMNEN